MTEKKKRGRKKIICALGCKKSHSFSLYPCEYDKLNQLFKELKKQRPNYYLPVIEMKEN